MSPHQAYPASCASRTAHRSTDAEGGWPGPHRRCGTRLRGAQIVALAAIVCWGATSGCGRDRPAGEIRGQRRPESAIAREWATQQTARLAIESSSPAARRPAKQILFGDLHVHSTYSIDAFVFSLPIFGGEGAHPPADACDFARYCAGVDFFSLNDHAEALTPERWQRTKESLRQCNALAGDPGNPDLVAFAGWEWTQAGTTPENHYGHRNVIFPGLADDQLPARPITALPDDLASRTPNLWALRGLQLVRAVGLGDYADFFWLIERLARMPACERGIDTRRLPHDCRENAPTPRELFEKLAQWGFDSIVIPHGLSWGVHAPLGAEIGNQLGGGQHDPERQRLLEVYSGHGNAEQYRPWRDVATDAAGNPVCPEPTRDFLPCCWRAGEIMRQRCGDLPEKECTARVEQAKRLALATSLAPHRVFPDTRPEDWLDCDQCRDCFKPAFTPRAGETAQYSLAISRPDERDGEGRPLRFRWGFIASSDSHQSRPGTGYKQYARRRMTDAHGVASETYGRILRLLFADRDADPRQPQAIAYDPQTFAALFDIERGASFMYPGGLVAVHAEGRRREAIWQALQRREVYGTSGPRILLWFDLLDSPLGAVPMGTEVTMSTPPTFQVRAVGAAKQLPGCPPESAAMLSRERLESLCHGECHHPGDDRHLITAIEVIRIRPQATRDEPVAALIEDPWRRFECRPDPAGCVVSFEDAEYASAGRDTLYYVRALQEATPAINGNNYRTEFDRDGNAVRISPCHGDYRTAFADDCLAPVQERAWSSPIFVDQPRAR
jgi:hypothetical protein